MESEWPAPPKRIFCRYYDCLEQHEVNNTQKITCETCLKYMSIEMKNKPKEPRNHHAVNAHMRNSAGPMDKKKRKKQKKRDRIREELKEMLLDVMKEIEDDE